MRWTRRKIIVALAAVAVLVGGVAEGRHLLSAGSAPSASSAGALSGSTATTSATTTGGLSPAADHASSGSVAGAFGTGNASKAAAPEASGSSSRTSTNQSGVARVPVFAVTPLVVHTATIHMRVGKGELQSVIRTVATVAGIDGGYVESSSVSGGTAQRSPVAGTITFRVLDSNFADAIKKVAGLGTVEDQQIQGKEVTAQVAENAASIVVLQDEVTLLESKLAETTDIGTFLQIQNQLFPVEQQLEQLQSAQSVVENSAALATVTVSLTGPGSSVVPVPKPRPHTDAATTAWRYLRHNSLAVMDGLAVGVGWALPVLVLLALVGGIALWVIRRRLDLVTPA